MSRPDYTPLRQYLKQQPSERQVLTLTFQEMEAILGFPLPPTALKDYVWWETLKKAGRWLETGWKPYHVSLSQKRVEFGRIVTALIADHSSRPSASAALRTYLRGLPHNRTHLVLSFADLAAIRGKPLSETARTDRTWWANTESSSHGRAWLSAGWEVDKVYLAAGLVTFHRVGMDTLGKIYGYAKYLLGEADPPGHPSPHELREWLRLCRRVGWLFEATVLFERGIPALPLPIGEVTQAEMEEDYRYCQQNLLRYAGQTA